MITELHGAQSGASDEGGQWIELANTTGGAVPLAGLQLHLNELDGSVEFEFFVRDAALEVPAGGRVVLARRNTGDLLPHIDYGYGLDYEGELFDAGELTISSCGTVIDHASWTQLPSTGSLALDGANPPDAEANDLAEGWCDDATPFGSPGEDNPPCP